MAKAKQSYDIVTVCQALGDATRYQIVATLHREGPTACGGFGLDGPAPTLSHHFNVLRKAGVIRTTIAGTKRINTLNEAELEAEFPGLLRSMFGGQKKRAARKPSVKKKA